jgi:ABC-type antimicrobial peptide transport system permease subunit
VVLLGVAIGVALGTIMSFNIVNDIQDDVESIRFSIPWVQIGVIIAVAYLFSLATTFLPALQASRIFLAEALRYE